MLFQQRQQKFDNFRMLLGHIVRLGNIALDAI